MAPKTKKRNVMKKTLEDLTVVAGARSVRPTVVQDAIKRLSSALEGDSEEGVDDQRLTKKHRVEASGPPKKTPPKKTPNRVKRPPKQRR